MERYSEIDQCPRWTAADQMAARLLIFAAQLFRLPSGGGSTFRRAGIEDSYEAKLQAFASLTDQQYSYLIRMAVAAKAESKSPRQITGLCLQQLAKWRDIDVPAIVQAQDNLAAGRKDKVELRIADMERRIKKLADKA